MPKANLSFLSFGVIMTRVNWNNGSIFFSKKSVLEKLYFDLTFTDFQTGSYKFGIYFKNEVFQ